MTGSSSRQHQVLRAYRLSTIRPLCSSRRWRHRRAREDSSAAAAERRPRVGIGHALLLGSLLFLGLRAPRYWSAPHHAVRFATAAPRSRTPFETSCAQARDWYLRAQAVTRGQLESLEEWDPDAMRDGAADLYRRRILTQTPEFGRAEVAAREAASRATTNEESCRATRLLVQIEEDRDDRRAQLALAKKLVALQPRNPGALLVLERAAAESGQITLARQVEVQGRASAPAFFAAFRLAALIPRDEARAERIPSRRLTMEPGE